MRTMNVCEDREYLNHKDIEEKMFTRVYRVLTRKYQKKQKEEVPSG